MSPSLASFTDVPDPAVEPVTLTGVSCGNSGDVLPQTSNSAKVRKFTAGEEFETRWMRMVSASTPRRAAVPHARELRLSVAPAGKNVPL